MMSQIRILLALTLVCLGASVIGVGPLAGAEMESVGGMPAVIVDSQPQAPLAFFGNTQFGRDANVWAQVAKAAQAGFHLHMVSILPPWWESLGSADTKCNAVLSADPQAMILVQVSLNPTWDWISSHPDAEYKYADGTADTETPQASVTSAAWQQDAGEQLRALVQHLRDQAYGSHVIGIYINYMTTAEWIYLGTHEAKHADYSPVNAAAFRTWLAGKYRVNAALEAAWHDPAVTLATAQIPTPAERNATQAFEFRDPSTSDQKTIDYYRFMADAVIDAQEYFRRIVKDETAGQWLAMHYFGYAYELADPPFRANYSGHMAYARRSLGSPTLDAAAGPYSYAFRGEGEPGGSLSAQHSWALYDQLYWHEDDTPAGYGGVTLGSLPMMIQLGRRNGARQLVYGGGLWWMDMLCDGWWDYQEFWDAVAPLKSAYQDYLLGGDRSLDPEFVVIADPDVFAYQSDVTNISGDAMSGERRYLETLGAQAGYFTSQDLRQPAFPQEHAKLYYFINPYAVDDEYLGWINAHLRKDGNVLVWLYAPGLITPAGLSDAHMSEVTGISLRHSTQPLSLRTVITDDSNIATQGLAGFEFGPLDAHNPIVYADAGQEATTTLGVYRDDPGKIAYCVKDFGTWKSVFVGAGGMLYVPVLRGLANLAGVHLYTPTSLWPSYDDGIAASKDFLAVHAASDGTRTLQFPETQSEIRNVFTDQVLATNTAALSLPVTFGQTYLLKLSPRLASEVMQYDVSDEVQVARAFTATLTYSNRGRDTWSGAGGYALVSQAPIGNPTWGESGMALGASDTVAPEETYTFTLSLTAPDSPGVYPCRWRMSEVGGRGGFGVSAHVNVGVYTFPDVGPTHWAWESTEACVGAGIVGGYDDGLYHPANPVSRDQMAVFISRSICTPTGEMSLDDYVPPTTPSFSDVPTDFWCYKYIEYAAEHTIVGGYEDGTYQPQVTIDRGQMAVFIARALAGDDQSVPDPVGDPSFPDVPADFWSYRHIEYIAAEGVCGGYTGGLYHPEYVCTRDQMAVYITRAFHLL